MIELFAVLLAVLLPPCQERKEDNSWLRYKPGTWIKNTFRMEYPNGHVREDVQTLTLKETDGDDFVVEESWVAPGAPPTESRRSRGVAAGTEKLTIAGKELDCKITVVKGKNDKGPTESRFWTPAGSRNAVKVVFKQEGAEGELTATSIDDKVTALGKTLVCNKLQGKMKFGAAEGTVTVILCEDIPGSQVRADLVLKGPDGETKIRFEAKEMDEKK